jgi:hypothetical protein
MTMYPSPPTYPLFLKCNILLSGECKLQSLLSDDVLAAAETPKRAGTTNFSLTGNACVVDGLQRD